LQLTAPQQIVDALRRIVRALRESSRAAEVATGLGGAQLFVLQRLAEAPALSVNALAERTLTHQSSVSVVVSRLEEQGLLTRRRADGDGRRRELALTATGRRCLRSAPPLAQQRIFEAIAQLGDGEQHKLATLLGRLTTLMQVDGQPAPMFFDEPAAPRRRAARGRAPARARARRPRPQPGGSR
jgi:DNA-binding MarR family transcriptional regulator